MEIGSYVLEDRLGQGGMAEVWLARHVHLGQPAAIKFLSAGFAENPDVASRFYDEARIMYSLHHPNIVAAKDFLKVNGRDYLVMEWMRNGTLADLMDRQPGVPFSIGQAWALMRSILSALSYAHAVPNPPNPQDVRPVYHRDVKPTNILFDEMGTPKLCDFGIARATNSGSNSGQRRARTRTGFSMGTSGYMSPEQMARPASVDGRSDLFNVGVVLYEMLTARLPFEDEEGIPDYRNPSPPRKWNASISPAMEAVMLRAIRLNPAERFASATEMSEALFDAVHERAAVTVPDPVRPLPTPTPPEPPKPPVADPGMVRPPTPPTLPVVPPPLPVPPPPPPTPVPSKSALKWTLGIVAVLVLIIGIGAVIRYQEEQRREEERREAARLEELRREEQRREEQRLRDEAGRRAREEDERRRQADEARKREEDAARGNENDPVKRAGDLAARYDAWLETRQKEMAPNVITTSLVNECPATTIHVVMRFKVPDKTDRWMTLGWWKVDSGATIKPKMATANSWIYFFAEGGGKVWNGEGKAGSVTAQIVGNRFAHVDGAPIEGRELRPVSMFRKVYDTWGNHTVRFTCTK